MGSTTREEGATKHRSFIENIPSNRRLTPLRRSVLLVEVVPLPADVHPVVASSDAYSVSSYVVADRSLLSPPYTVRGEVLPVLSASGGADGGVW